MKIRYGSILFLVLGYLSGYGQRPGGVADPVMWVYTEFRGNDRFVWSDGIEGKQGPVFVPESRPARTGQLLNFHPALRFTERTNAVLPLPDLSRGAFDLFTVYQSADSLYERNLWNIETRQTTRQVMTTHRMADLGAFRYMNYPHKGAGQPEINHYYQADKAAAADDRLMIRWGGLPARSGLPIHPFSGLIAEWVLYERVLTQAETARVESYLAIKYGITLGRPQPADYLDSRGRILWNGSQNAAYHHRLAGIGRDDASGLQQGKSTSSEAPGQLVIGIDSSALSGLTVPDRSFLLWGDNGQSRQWQPKKTGQPLRLQRSWRVQITGELGALPTFLQYDPRAIADRPAGDERYWLVVNYGGDERFEASNIEYYPFTQQDRQLVVNGIRWGAKGNTQAAFSIARGPELLVHATLRLPDCESAASGQIQLKVAGGRPPFRVTLSGQALRPVTLTAIESNPLLDFPGLDTGSYRLTVTDRDGRQYREDLFVESAEGPAIELADQYALSGQQQLSLNAAPSDRSPIDRYEWRGPQGYHHTGAVAKIQRPGTYQLILSAGGCVSHHAFLVERTDGKAFASIEALPNPVYSGNTFRVNVQLYEPQPVEMRIYDALGRAVLSKRQSGRSLYQFTGTLRTAGMYLVQLKTGASTHSIRLIVQS